MNWLSAPVQCTENVECHIDVVSLTILCDLGCVFTQYELALGSWTLYGEFRGDPQPTAHTYSSVNVNSLDHSMKPRRRGQEIKLVEVTGVTKSQSIDLRVLCPAGAEPDKCPEMA
ncbi:hypothetical protein J6590_007665 [Homalodisca vitripennis]|nr:hypothetical protein J6590_007665 [Homalodisca vitripennis]